MKDNSSAEKMSVLSILSIIFGVIGLLSSCLFIGIIPAIIGLIFGILAVVKKDKRAIIGIVCSIIGLIIGGCMLAWMISDISKENEVRDLIKNGKYETALEKIESYSFSSSVEEQFYYDIYVGQEKYDDAFLLIFSYIEENYDEIDTISEERIEKLKRIYDFVSVENQAKLEQFEKDRKELIQAKEEQERLEKEQKEQERKEQEQKEETIEVPSEEAIVKEENAESSTVENVDNKSIVERFEIDEREASTDEYIVDKLTVIEQYTECNNISELKEYLFDGGYMDASNEYADLDIVDTFIFCYRADNLTSYLEYAYEDAFSDESIQYQYVAYKDLMRYEEQYVGQYISMLVYVCNPIDNDVRMQSAFPAEATQFDGQVYYSCLNYDVLVIYDKRNASDVWLSSDIIEIHAKYLGKEEFISYNTNTTVEMPAFEVYESVLLQE